MGTIADREPKPPFPKQHLEKPGRALLIPATCRTRRSGGAGHPRELRGAFVFFASDADSSYITGEVLTLLGGETTAA